MSDDVVSKEEFFAELAGLVAALPDQATEDILAAVEGLRSLVTACERELASRGVKV